jgi:hypothetical protein
MGYALVLVPAALIYLVMKSATDLSGEMIAYAMVPSTIILVLWYLIYLFKPMRFLETWISGETDHEMKK